MEISKNKVIITSVVGLFVLGELLWGVSYLSRTSLPLRKTQAREGARLVLSPAQKSFRRGEEVEVRLDLDTQGINTSGVDVILSYDPAMIEIMDADSTPANGVQIRPGLLYQRYPINEVDPAKGKIGFSAVSVPPNTFSGSGTLAYIKLRALKAGVTTLRIEFRENDTTDSNVARAGSAGEDVLDRVINARYSIKD